MKVLVCVLFILFNCSCNTAKPYEQRFFENGSLKELIINGKNSRKSKVIYTFYENGSLKKVNRYGEPGQLNGEQIFFFRNGGLDRKIPYSNGIANGNTYYFFESSGALKNVRFFKDGREALYGSDYWDDSIEIRKAWLYFNDNGQVIYKKDYDENGKLINEEGVRN